MKGFRLLVAATLALAACRRAPVPSHPHPYLNHAVDASVGRALGSGERVLVPTAGAVTVLDFWAMACEPCVRMMPELARMYDELRSRGVVMVGIAHETNPVAALETAKLRGATYPQLLDQDGAFDRAWQVGGRVPTTIVVDRTGHVRHVRYGAAPGTLEREISAIRDAVHEALEAP